MFDIETKKEKLIQQDDLAIKSYSHGVYTCSNEIVGFVEGKTLNLRLVAFRTDISRMQTIRNFGDIFDVIFDDDY